VNTVLCYDDSASKITDLFIKQSQVLFKIKILFQDIIYWCPKTCFISLRPPLPKSVFLAWCTVYITH